jgi:hypothetical protein
MTEDLKRAGFSQVYSVVLSVSYDNQNCCVGLTWAVNATCLLWPSSFSRGGYHGGGQNAGWISTVTQVGR